MSGLLRALHADVLNDQLRAAGQKPFHCHTIKAFRGQAQHVEASPLVFHSTSAKCFAASEAQALRCPIVWKLCEAKPMSLKIVWSLEPANSGVLRFLTGS